VQTSEEMLARIADGSNSYSVAVIEICKRGCATHPSDETRFFFIKGHSPDFITFHNEITKFTGT
jgi:hypothetical protein